MIPFVVGTREDVVGFALAAVGGVICSTVDEVEHAFGNLREDQIVILSAAAAAPVADRITEWEKSGRGPLFVVLPAR
jgi:vacuolar-type H+-ATPase subunit F/Vma7